jgi:SAM-dependent methyltransferase
MTLQKDTDATRTRWLIGQEKEKGYNAKREDLEERIVDRRITWARLLDLLKDEVTFDNSKRILDIGAEATSIFLILREGKKYAVDPLFDYLFQMHPFLREIEEYKDVNFISSPLEDMVSDKGFDIIFTLASINHIDKVKPFISKIDELLLPSGILVAVVECYPDRITRNIMSFFDPNLFHPNHYTTEDIMRLFSSYRLIKREQIEEIYTNIPSERRKPKMKTYRIDRIIRAHWQLLGEWGNRRNILFVLKFFLAYGLVFLIGLLRRQGYPLSKHQLFIFQRP